MNIENLSLQINNVLIEAEKCVADDLNLGQTESQQYTGVLSSGGSSSTTTKTN